MSTLTLLKLFSQSVIRVVLLKVKLYQSYQNPQMASHLTQESKQGSSQESKRAFMIYPKTSSFFFHLLHHHYLLVILIQQKWLPCFSLQTPSSHLVSLTGMLFSRCLHSSFPRFLQVSFSEGSALNSEVIQQFLLTTMLPSPLPCSCFVYTPPAMQYTFILYFPY